MSYTLRNLKLYLGDLWNVGWNLWGITLLVWNTWGSLCLFCSSCFVIGQRNGRKISPQSLGILVKAKNALLIDLVRCERLS